MSKSGLSDQDLASVLGSVRKIAALSDGEAIDALDRLLTYLRIEGRKDAYPTLENDWRRHQFEDAVERLKRDFLRLRSGLADPAVLNAWDPETLRRQADALPQWLDAGLEFAYADMVRALRKEALDLAQQVAYAIVAHSIKEAATRTIHSVTSAKSILATLEEARDQLVRLGKMSEAHAAEMRAAKERAAWYRARKHIEDAQVAAAGSNAKKANKLLAEALVILRQDWAEAFPNEASPPLPELGAV